MDGTDLLLDPFRRAVSTHDDRDRVIAVDYPYKECLSVKDLASYVVDTYLSPLKNDTRGYVIVNQSFSGYVGFNLSSLKQLPGTLKGQVFVNAFASPPGPSFLRGLLPSAASSFFERQPPPWMVSPIFLGPNAQGMEKVQAAAALVKPEVMIHRLSLCLSEDAWDFWRNRTLLPSSRTLYLRGEDDFIISRSHVQQLRSSRPDISWVSIPKGPHLLLQRYGWECGVAVNKFCVRLQTHLHVSTSIP